MEVIREQGFTADLHTDVAAKLRAARRALRDHALVYVHIKATDLFSHDFQPLEKRDFIERVDAALRPLVGSGAAIALSADHTTDSNSGAHTADPVPSFIALPGDVAERAEGFNFGEMACRERGRPRRDGHSFLAEILDYLDG
jgi:2,3-bisphosphoglycerate-independent phosphoglycerate mutase